MVLHWVGISLARCNSFSSSSLPHSDSSSPAYPFPCPPSSISPQYICSSPFNLHPKAPTLPTPPDSEGHCLFPPKSFKTSSNMNMFNFSSQPPPPPPMFATPSPQGDIFCHR